MKRIRLPELTKMLAALSFGFVTAVLHVALPEVCPALKTVEVRMMVTPDGNDVFFDPVGIRIEPGDTVRWVQIDNYHSVSAYHPENDNHELRIPENAESWDSGIIEELYPSPNSKFEHKFTIEGVYDYFCRPHERSGMVGRIIVGKPSEGPGTKPFGYDPDKKWKPMPEAAKKRFPSVEEIMAKGNVRSPLAKSE